MAHRIWQHDSYALRKYGPKTIDYFLDIGACVGTTSLLFKTIDPFAKIRAIEPCFEDYQILHPLGKTWGFKTYNFALGDGEPMCFGRKNQGTHKFYTKADRKWWPDVPEFFAESKTITEIFEFLHIKGRYIVKVDCEGGERFILNDPKSIPLIEPAIQFNIELHRFGGPLEAWAEWFGKFKTTHRLYKRTTTREHDENGQDIYHEIDAPDSNNQKEYMLVKI